MFERGYRLMAMKPGGTDAEELHTNGFCSEPCISPDGNRIAYVKYSSRPQYAQVTTAVPNSISTISAKGGGEVSVMLEGPGKIRYMDPSYSPDGKSLCFAFDEETDGPRRYGVMVTGLVQGSGPRTVISEEAEEGGLITQPRFSPDGNYVYFLKSGGGGPPAVELERVRTDGSGREVFGRFEPGDPNTGAPARGYMAFDISNDGKIVTALASCTMGDYVFTLRFMNADGSGVRDVDLGEITRRGDWIYTVCWSPGGKTIAFTALAYPGRSNLVYQPDLYLVNEDGTGLGLLTKKASEPSWGRTSR